MTESHDDWFDLTHDAVSGPPALHPDGPSRAQALAQFFDAESYSRTAPTRARYARVLTRLHEFLDDVDVAPYLGTGPAALLVRERDRERAGAFLRVFGFDELLCCLEGFLLDPWLPVHRGERKTQVSLVERLVRHMRLRGWIEMPVVACAYLDLEIAIERARRGDEPRLPGSQALPPGLRLLDPWVW